MQFIEVDDDRPIKRFAMILNQLRARFQIIDRARFGKEQNPARLPIFKAGREKTARS